RQFGRNRRTGGSSVVSRLSVSPRVHVDAARRSSVVHRFHSRRARSRPLMKLAGADIGTDRPLFLIAGPDSLESTRLAMDVAGNMAELCCELGVPYVFKGSFDKANRSSHDSYRGPGMAAGLEILATVKRELGVAVTTDVHVEAQIAPVAAVV